MKCLLRKPSPSHRSLALMLLVACAPYAPISQSAEHFAAATYAYELAQRANSVALLEHDYLLWLDATSGDALFDLYRNYNRLIGTWVQVDLLQARLDDSVDTGRSDDAMLATLRNQARYVRWELDSAIASFEHDADERPHRAHARLAEDSVLLLSNVRVTVDRLYLATGEEAR